MADLNRGEPVGSNSTDPGRAYTNTLLQADRLGFSYDDAREMAQAEADRVKKLRRAE